MKIINIISAQDPDPELLAPGTYSGGGAKGLRGPPGPVKSIDFRGFSGSNGC